MDSTKNNKMMNADVENTAGLKKDTPCYGAGSSMKVVLLIVSALLAGMVIATVIIFATGLHLSKPPTEVSEHHKNHHPTGERHHNQENHENRGTDAPNDDDDDKVAETKDAKYWWYSSGPECQENEYACWNDGHCIMSSSVCDGNEDCSDGSDEIYCTQCQENEYTCWNDGHCIMSSSVCDGNGDCSDGSDEIHCEYYGPEEPAFPEEPSNPEQPSNPNPEQPSNPNPNPEQPANPNPNPNPEQPSNPGTGITWEQLQSQCGQSSLSLGARIVNGEDVTDGSVWPWAGYLSTLQDQFFCGAQLISPQWAVTATHCVEDNSPIKITFGRLNQQGSRPSTAVEKTISSIIRHPSYDSNTINNDIALLKLNSPVTISDTLRPVCINADQNEYSTYAADDACWVVGWGATSSGGPTSTILQQVKSPLVDNHDVCKTAYQGQGEITDQMICSRTDHAASGSGSCQGDSGGPMVCRNSDNKFYLTGITSWGIGCADRQYPDVMARVSQFNNFIRDNIENQL